MKPGSLRIVAQNKYNSERLVEKFEAGTDAFDEFFNRMDYLDTHGFNTWVYEMTDKGWTEF